MHNLFYIIISVIAILRIIAKSKAQGEMRRGDYIIIGIFVVSIAFNLCLFISETFFNI